MSVDSKSSWFDFLFFIHSTNHINLLHRVSHWLEVEPLRGFYCFCLMLRYYLFTYLFFFFGDLTSSRSSFSFLSLNCSVTVILSIIFLLTIHKGNWLSIVGFCFSNLFSFTNISLVREVCFFFHDRSQKQICHCLIFHLIQKPRSETNQWIWKKIERWVKTYLQWIINRIRATHLACWVNTLSRRPLLSIKAEYSI